MDSLGKCHLLLCWNNNEFKPPQSFAWVCNVGQQNGWFDKDLLKDWSNLCKFQPSPIRILIFIQCESAPETQSLSCDIEYTMQFNDSSAHASFYLQKHKVVAWGQQHCKDNLMLAWHILYIDLIPSILGTSLELLMLMWIVYRK